VVATLSGDRPQLMGRLAEPVQIGPYTITNPIVDVTDDLSSLGGEILQNFIVTFDQQDNEVSFQRDTNAPIPLEPRRSSGLSFSKTPAYWRIQGVIPGSPAAGTSIQTGDLCTKINGDPVARWDFRRYARLVHDSDQITYTFLNGATEYDVTVPVFNLVP
jgi:C-terminal processing protease CtpA/Prc